MKTKKLFVVAALLPLLFSCAKEEIVNNDNLNGEGEKYDFTITVSEDEESITKASFSDTDGIFWVAGGKAGIVKKDGENTVKYESSALKENDIYTYPHPEGEEGKKYNQASFEFAETYAGEYKFFYPYHSDATLDKIPFWVDPNQKTSAGSSSDCFALVSDGMVSLTTDNHDLGATTTYKVVGSYIRFLPFGKEGEVVKFIVIEGAEKTVSGRYFVNGNDNTLRSGETDLTAETIILSVENDYAVAAAKEDAQGLYTPVLPGKSKNSYTVLTDKGFYLFESGSEKEFKFGAIKDIPLNLNKAARTPKSLYVVGDATTAGWTADKAIALTKVENENKYKIENIPLVPGGEGFKFLTKRGDWSNALVNAGENKLAYYVDVPDDKDIKFTVDQAGYYNLVVDFDAMTCTITKIKDTVLPQVYTYPDGNENVKKVNMSFTETEKVYKAIIYLAEGDRKHDFKINYNNQYYHVNLANGGWQEVNFGPAEDQHKVYYDWDVIADNSDQGWYVYNEYCNKYYELTFDSDQNKVTLKLAQGNSFWITGYQFGRDENNTWIKDDKYKSTVVDGKVTWEFEILDGGGFNILGEYGEYYNSTNTDGYWNWNSSTYGWEPDARFKNGLKPWNFTEGGKYKVTFWPSTLKIKVEKIEEKES